MLYSRAGAWRKPLVRSAPPQKTIEQQNEVIAGLEARLAKLEARLPTEPER
jgi:hypothetical protein